MIPQDKLPLSVNTTNVGECERVIQRFYDLGHRHSGKDLSQFSAAKLAEYAYDRPVYPTIGCYGEGPIHLTKEEPGAMSAQSFLSTYPVPIQPTMHDPSLYPPVKVATHSDNPPIFIVDTNGNKTLSAIVQRLAFDKGFKWANGREVGELYETPYRYMLFPRVDQTGVGKANRIYHTDHNSHPYPILDAATQFGEIVRLFETPVVIIPPAPVIHDYTGRYLKNGETITFGCAEISVNLLECVAAVAGKKQPGNRTIANVTLSSGKVLTIASIKECLAYVEAVNNGLVKAEEAPF